MSSKTRRDDEESANVSKPLNKKTFERQTDEINARFRKIEEETVSLQASKNKKSLNIRVPDKKFYAAQKEEDFSRLNDVKFRRENQFKEKRIVDNDLREVNKQVQTKYDVVGKLKSSLKYKNAERVDDVIRKLERQIEMLHMKPNEERRILQEISSLKQSKTKIQDFLKAEEEVRQLKMKQKELRERRDENVSLITSLKQEEMTARSILEQHKITEDQEWAVYKENLSKRTQLWNEKDLLQKEKKDLNDQYRKVSRRESQRGLHSLLLSEQDTKPRDGHSIHTRFITERKKLYDDDIKMCNVLLKYLAKHESQAVPLESNSDVKERETATNELKSNENVQGIENQLSSDEVIYRGIRRKPSRRERRRKQHVGEAQRKLEHHVIVLEKFVSLGIQPPATVAEIPSAERAIREKKKFLKDSQESLTVMKLQQVNSSPFVDASSSNYKRKDTERVSSDLVISRRISKEEMMARKSKLDLTFPKRHKSCPSLPGAVKLAAIDSPYSCTSKESSENEFDSPRSSVSSTSVGELKSFPTDEGQQPHVPDNIEYYSQHPKQEKGQHRVHFASEVDEYVGNESKALSEAASISQGEEREEREILDNAIKYHEVNITPEADFTSDNSHQSLKYIAGEEYLTSVKQFEEQPNASLLGREGPFRSKLNSDQRDEDISANEQFISAVVARKNADDNLDGKSDDEKSDDEKSDDEKSDDDNAKNGIDLNELQFEIDDIPPTKKQPILKESHSRKDSSSLSDGSIDGTESGDSLQFEMDDVTPIASVEGQFIQPTDSNGAIGHKVTDNFGLPSMAPGGCSPRRSQDYLYLDKEDSVEVTT